MNVWFIDLRDPLPTVAVPLSPSFEDAPLELQPILAETYSRAHYADSVDYTRPIPPPLQPPLESGGRLEGGGDLGGWYKTFGVSEIGCPLK